MNTTLVLHHSADFDGLASRAVAHKAYGDTADYLGWDYGQPLPDLSPYSTVYMIDISLPIEIMEKKAHKIILIDHHKTLIDAVAPFKDSFKGYYCIDGVAACRLAHQWFLKEGRDVLGMIWLLPDKTQFVDRMVDEPYAIQLLGEYDIWDKRNPDTDLFQLGIQAEGEPNWDVLLSKENLELGEDLVNVITGNGSIIQRYTDTINAQISTERGFDLQWEGFYWRCLNTARCNSMTFTAALRPEHDGCLAYHWNGKHWKFSLYGVPHKPTLNLSVVSKKYGGGGHAQASGFQLSMLPQELGGA
jgi:hypothetical protein